MHPGSSMEDTPIPAPIRSHRVRYRIEATSRSHGGPSCVVVEAGDIAEAIGPWYASHTSTELQWMAVEDLQQAALTGAPLRVYARILNVIVTEVTDPRDRPTTAVAEEPTQTGAHVRDRHGHVWIRQHVGWLSPRGRQRLTWRSLQKRYGPLVADEETRLLETLGPGHHTA